MHKSTNAIIAKSVISFSTVSF